MELFKQFLNKGSPRAIVKSVECNILTKQKKFEKFDVIK
jgi:acylphosphatase